MNLRARSSSEYSAEEHWSGLNQVRPINLRLTVYAQAEIVSTKFNEDEQRGRAIHLCASRMSLLRLLFAIRSPEAESFSTTVLTIFISPPAISQGLCWRCPNR